MERFSRRIRALLVVGAICPTLALAGCWGATSSSPAAGATATATSVPVGVQHDVAYGPLPDEKLDLCEPKSTAGTHPGVILIHGGGWHSGDKSGFEPVCTYLAGQGFVATTINYRLGPAHHWPAQVVDAQLAVRWMRAHAASLDLDPTRLCSYGSSAGAHLAVFLGVLHTIHAGDEANLYTDHSPAATCVVDEFGPVDLADLNGSNATPTPAQQQALSALFGSATPQSDPAIYRDASPIIDVSAQSAPTLIVQGTQDTTVPPAQSQELQSALQRAGVSVQYLAYPGGHGFSGLSTEQVRAITLQTVQYLQSQEHPA